MLIRQGVSILVGAALQAGLMATPAFAKEGDQLEEVVVTASKRAERLLDVPSALQVIDTAQIENLGLRGFDDYVGLVPNVTQRSFGAPGAGTVIIRGLNTGPQQTTSTAGFYLDDTPFTASGSLSVASLVLPDADLADVERIELLKGPQGTLYGASSLGGLVRILSRKPDLTKFEGSASVTASTVDGGGSGFGLRGTLNMPLAKNRVAVRLTGFNRREPGFADNVGTGTTNINEATISGLRAAVLASISDSVELQFNGLFQNTEADGFAAQDNVSGTLTPLYGERQYNNYYNTGSELEIRSVGATLNWKVGPGTLTAMVGRSRYTTRTEADYTPIYGPLLAGFGLPPGAGLGGALEPESRKTSVELRYASERVGRFEFLAGAFYTDEDNLYPLRIDGEFAATRQPLPSIFGNLINVGTASAYEEKAIFANATFYFNDDWDVTLGGRYSENEQTADITRSGLLVGIFGSPVVQSFALDDDASTYLATLRWRASENVSAFLRAATGYRPGGPQTNAAAPNSNSSYKPDEVTNYELGFKSRLLDGRLDLSASAYRIDWDDIQLNTLVNGFLLIGNGGAARVNGLEIEAASRPTDSLSLGLTLGYNDTEVTEIGVAEAQQLGAAVGDALPLSSNWNASALLDYRFSLKGLGVSVGGTVKYNGERPTSFSQAPLNPNVQLPSDTLIDLRAGVDFGRVNAQFRIENLTDENGISSYITNKVVAVLPVPSVLSLVRPRTYSLTLNVRF
jgi:iron complex outermembrane receptor protein